MAHVRPYHTLPSIATHLNAPTPLIRFNLRWERLVAMLHTCPGHGTYKGQNVHF